VGIRGRLAAFYFCYFAFVGVFSTYFGLYLQSQGLSAWHIGVLLSVMQSMRLVAPNLWGWLADRLGRRAPAVRLSTLASVAACAIFFSADSFAMLLLAMALLAFFWSASLPLVEAITLGHLERQPERYGRIRLWGSLGFIAAVISLGVLLDHVATTAVLWAALLCLGGAAVASLLLADPPPLPAAESATRLGEALRRPHVQALFAACFCMAFAHAPYYVFYSIFLAGEGYSKTLVGLLWAVGVVAEIGVFVWMPRLLRRHGARRILLASFAAAALRFVAIGWGVGWPALIFAAQLLHGATFGAFHAAAVATLNRWFGGRHQARVQALYGSVSFGAGGMAGGLLAAWVWDPFGAGTTFTLAASAAVVGGWLIWRHVEPAV